MIKLLALVFSLALVGCEASKRRTAVTWIDDGAFIVMPYHEKLVGLLKAAGLPPSICFVSDGVVTRCERSWARH